MRRWLTKQRRGFFLKSEPKAVGKGRNYWIGFKESNGDVTELAITWEIWNFIRKGRRP